jgi:hypothetical protein
MHRGNPTLTNRQVGLCPSQLPRWPLTESKSGTWPTSSLPAAVEDDVDGRGLPRRGACA